MATRLTPGVARAVALAVALAGAVAAHALKQRAVEARASWADTEGFVILPPPGAARALSLGYRQLWADVTFARALVYSQDTRRDVTEFRYLERFIDNILALDPGFKRVYAWAHYAVLFKNELVTQEEFRTSVRYLERAMNAFPDEYEFFWVAGLRYFLDLRSDDPEEQRRLREHGADLIEQAMHKPNAPPRLATLAASMRTQLGQKARALNDLREMILLADNPKAQQRMIDKYNALAGVEFPDEALAAKRALEASWRRELPFASPSLHILLGERPSPVIDFDQLATERDLFGANLDPMSDSADRDAPGAGDDDSPRGASPEAGSEASDEAGSDAGAAPSPAPGDAPQPALKR